MRQLAQTLAPDEQLRAERFYFERDRLYFIVGRGLLRTILGQYLRREPNQLHFCYGPFGKPVLPETSSAGKLSFNLAHSAGLALYAVVRDHEIGVDLEQLRPMMDMEQIAARFFAVGERAALQALPAQQKQEGFFNCWTRKEAYLKALGSGLARPLAEFEVSLTPGEPARLVKVNGEPDEASRWVIQALTPAAGYAAALALPAIPGITWQLNCWQWICPRF